MTFYQDKAEIVTLAVKLLGIDFINDHIGLFSVLRHRVWSNYLTFGVLP
jgi:hypothetical protein